MRITVRVRVDEVVLRLAQAPAEVRDTVRQWASGPAPQYTKAAMQRIIRARKRGNYPTGRTEASVEYEKFDSGFRVGPRVAWAQYLDQPTRPHEIRPRNAKVLVFARAGARAGTRKGRAVSVFRFGGKQVTRDAVYATVVHHPGTPGMFYIQGTADAVRGPVADMLREMLRKRLQEG